jgi:hypothetical protein
LGRRLVNHIYTRPQKAQNAQTSHPIAQSDAIDWGAALAKHLALVLLSLMLVGQTSTTAGQADSVQGSATIAADRRVAFRIKLPSVSNVQLVLDGRPSLASSFRYVRAATVQTIAAAADKNCLKPSVSSVALENRF